MLSMRSVLLPPMPYDGTMISIEDLADVAVAVAVAVRHSLNQRAIQCAKEEPTSPAFTDFVERGERLPALISKAV